MSTQELLDNYIRNSLKSGNFSTLDMSSHINISDKRNYILKEPNMLGTESKIDTYMYSSDIPKNETPIRNVFQNFGFSAETNCNNEEMAMYSSAHFEPHTKSKKGEDIII
jgi:hypothetical protein